MSMYEKHTPKYITNIKNIKEMEPDINIDEIESTVFIKELLLCDIKMIEYMEKSKCVLDLIIYRYVELVIILNKIDVLKYMVESDEYDILVNIKNKSIIALIDYATYHEKKDIVVYLIDILKRKYSPLKFQLSEINLLYAAKNLDILVKMFELGLYYSNVYSDRINTSQFSQAVAIYGIKFIELFTKKTNITMYDYCNSKDCCIETILYEIVLANNIEVLNYLLNIPLGTTGKLISHRIIFELENLDCSIIELCIKKKRYVMASIILNNFSDVIS